MSRTAITRLRNQDLLAKTTEIRDFAVAAQAEPGAAGRGVTAARIAALSAALAAFTVAVNAPRTQVATRSSLLRELETDVAGLMESVAALDDLVLQFGGTPGGRHLIESWHRARVIVDAVGSRTTAAIPTPLAPAPVAPK